MDFSQGKTQTFFANIMKEMRQNLQGQNFLRFYFQGNFILENQNVLNSAQWASSFIYSCLFTFLLIILSWMNQKVTIFDLLFVQMFFQKSYVIGGRNWNEWKICRYMKIFCLVINSRLCWWIRNFKWKHLVYAHRKIWLYSFFFVTHSWALADPNCIIRRLCHSPMISMLL